MNKNTKINVRGLSFSYNGKQILDRVDVLFEKNCITSITGPSGQGKSSFLMVLNRLWENIPGAAVTGRIEIDFGSGPEDIMAGNYPLPTLRQRVGMVFQTPNPLPMSVFANIAFPLKLAGATNRTLVSRKVKAALKRAYLWQEVKDRLNEPADTLSGGQQQRMCIARTLVMNPQVLLLDEPTSSLDEKSGKMIECLLLDLKKQCTIILVSHYMDQVKRIADRHLVLSDKNVLPSESGSLPK